MKSVFMIGCGWLGFPLARQLHASGYHVSVTTRTKHAHNAFAEAGIDPYLADFSLTTTKLPAQEADIVIITVPPGDKEGTGELLHSRIADAAAGLGAKQHIYFSSTSVYPDQQGEFSEKDVAPGKLEQVYKDKLPALCILRPGGLVGPGRIPGKFFSGRINVAMPYAGVNLVHQDDVISATQFVIHHKLTGFYNVVTPGFATRNDFYTRAAIAAGCEIPLFDMNDTRTGKSVLTHKLTDNGFSYKYREPFELIGH